MEKPIVIYTDHIINKTLCYNFAKGSNSLLCHVDKFKEYDLSKYWGLNKRRDNYKPYKNLNILLVRFESLLMRSLMKTLKQNNIDFISVYDSFMVRELDIEKTFNILNRSVKNYGRCLTFKT